MDDARAGIFVSRDFAFSLICWSLIAGPFGVLIAAIWHFAQSRTARNPPFDMNEWFSGATTDTRLERVATVCEALRDRRYNFDADEPLVAFSDCMRTGSQQERLAALRAIGADYGYDFAPVLQAGSLNTDAAVRVMAATVMAAQKKSFSDRIAVQEWRMRVEPNRQIHCLRLALVLLEYANAGLIDGELALEQLHRARALLMKCSHVDAVGSRYREPLLAAVDAAQRQYVGGA